MHRIKLTRLLGTRNYQRSYQGILETNASGSWVADTENTTPVISRWVTLGKSVSEVPGASLMGTLYDILQPSEVDRVYTTPDFIDLSLTGVTSLQLPAVVPVTIVNMTTGAKVTPTSVTYTTISTTIVFPVSEGYHRLFLTKYDTQTYDTETSTNITDGVIRLRGELFVHTDLRSGVATTSWSSVRYEGGYTYIDIGEEYEGTGALLTSRAYSFQKLIDAAALMVRFHCETPIVVRTGAGVYQTPVQYLTNGFTYVSTTDFVSPMTFMVSLWAYRLLNPETAVPYAGPAAQTGLYSITQEDVLDAVRLMHQHANLDSLDVLQVVNGTLYVDGTAINPEELNQLLVAIQELIEDFDPTNHTHLMSQVSGLVTALAGKSDTGHAHAMSDVANLVTTLAQKAALSHQHTVNDITSLSSTLSIMSAAIAQHTQSIARVDGLQAILDAKMPCVEVDALPAAPVVDVVYRLTEDDPDAKASPGLYLYTGVSYLCLAQNYAYDLGEVSGTLDLPNIINVIYVAKAVDALAVNLPTFTNIGNIVLRLEDGGSHVVTWSSNVKWADASLPVLTVEAYDWLVFASSDGYDWGGSLQIKNVEIVTREMTSTWVTAAPNTTVTLPFVAEGTYNCTVDWGDGTTTIVHAYNDAGASHVYAAAGTYTVTISGVASHWSFNNTGTSKNLITAVTNLGSLGWKNFNGGFYGCTNLTSVVGGDVSQVTDMTNMFRSVLGVGATFTVSTWDTSRVTSMRSMFRNSTGAPDDVSGWDTGAVTDMSYMFYANAAANPDVSGWDVSNVITIEAMFYDAITANPDTSSWTVTDLTTVTNAFRNCVAMLTAVTAASFWENADITNYVNCFTGAVNISNYADIPNGWKGL